MAMPIGVTYGLVTGISEAMTPAGLAYLTMPFSGDLLDDAHALLPEGIAKDPEDFAAAARLGAAHAAFGDAHCRQPGRGRLVAAGPGDGAAEPIDARLIERPRPRASRRVRARSGRRRSAVLQG